MSGQLIVRPVKRAEAAYLCAGHPHANILPNSSKYYMAATIDGREAGLAVWGWGIMPRATPSKLFADGASGINDYLELCRFFVHDWCPKNSASRFLSTTHRILRKYAPQVKYLYTYAAGFQGMVGGIYKAAGYEYLGTTHCDSFVYVPNVGLIHRVSRWGRYGARHDDLTFLASVFGPGIRRWHGDNFRYLYWLCDAAERARLMAAARFTVQPYPTEADLHIWLEDAAGHETPVEPAFAKTIPIVNLRTTRAGSILADAPVSPDGRGRGGTDPGAPAGFPAPNELYDEAVP
jgi:hypothetical protein